MTQLQRNESQLESTAPIKDQNMQLGSLTSCKLTDLRVLNNSSSATPDLLPKLNITEHRDVMYCSTPKDSGETKEQQTDKKIKEQFGSDVLEHLKDWDWLIKNRKTLQDGFKKASNDDAWEMAWRMRELSKVDGKPLIYLSKQDGPTRGTLIPKRHDIYLRRGGILSDDYIGQVTH